MTLQLVRLVGGSGDASSSLALPILPASTESPPAPVTEQSTDEDLEREAVDLAVAPYRGLNGVLERADALANVAARRGLISVVASARIVRADVLARTRIAEGAQLAHELVRWANEAGDRLIAARAHIVLALALDRLGHTAESVANIDKASSMLDDDAPLYLRALHAVNFAMLTGGARSGTISPTPYEHADNLASQLGDSALVVGNLNNLAWAYVLHHQVEPAYEAVQRLTQVAYNAGLVLNAFVLDTIAHVLLERGEVDDAARIIEMALDGRIPEEEPHAIAICMLTVARIKRRMGDYSAAFSAVRMARDFSSTSGEADAAAEALRELAGLYAAAGDYRSAYDAQVEFQEQWEELRSQQSDIAAATLQAIFETQLAQRRSRLFEELAEHDQLTGLGNRRYLYQRLPGLLQTAQRQDSPLSLAMIDLDHFKAINDSHSHDVGDAVLESVGCLLRDAVAGSGFAVRLGGEEFVLAMPDCALEKAHGICITMCNSLATHDWAAISRGLAVTASVGLVVNTCDDTASSLLHRADEHLYRAKREGRDRVVSQNDPTANPAPTVEMTALRR